MEGEIGRRRCRGRRRQRRRAAILLTQQPSHRLPAVEPPPRYEEVVEQHDGERRANQPRRARAARRRPPISPSASSVASVDRSSSTEKVASASARRCGASCLRTSLVMAKRPSVISAARRPVPARRGRCDVGWRAGQRKASAACCCVAKSAGNRRCSGSCVVDAWCDEDGSSGARGRFRNCRKSALESIVARGTLGALAAKVSPQNTQSPADARLELKMVDAHADASTSTTPAAMPPCRQRHAARSSPSRR